MNRELLNRKLAENKRRLKEIRINEMKSEITQSIENFPEKYRFANDNEKKRIEIFIEKLPAFYNKIDFSALLKSPVTEHGKCYLCFLEGSEEILDMYIYGNFSDFLRDYDDFFFFSAYLLIIDEDFRRFVFIDDDFNQKESYID
ncbi:MAG: hypothetical protein NC244_08190 [Alistipes senegalensis]|nr:hypothetical protein [Alistipes senegalensis]